MSAYRLVLGVVVNSAGSAGPREIASQVAAAESRGFSLVLFDDGPGEPGAPTGSGYLDPIETAAFASARTASIGLIATAAATHAEPYHLSNRFSSLDWDAAPRLAAAADEARAAGAGRVLAELNLPPLDAPSVGQELMAVLRRLAGEVDGVLFRPSAGAVPAVPGVLARDILPALAADGVLVPPVPGQTLRDQFGLTRPLSRYADSLPGART